MPITAPIPFCHIFLLSIILNPLTSLAIVHGSRINIHLKYHALKNKKTYDYLSLCHRRFRES